MSEMKDSGIEWIGATPETWKMIPLKYLASYNDEVLSENTDDEFEFDYIEIGSVQYGRGIIYTEHMKFKNAPSRARRIVRKDDIIVSTVRTYLKAVATIPACNNSLIASTGFIVIRPHKVLPRFMNYALLSESFISLVESHSTGISYPAINSVDVVKFKIPVPCRSEQERIAAFLDAECAEIDAVLEKTRASIEEYKKLKQAIITQAVTKGIRGDRPMKDSGIEWIGDIPESWEVSSVRYIGQLQNGISKGGEFFGKGFPFVSYGDVYKNYELPHSVSGLIDTTEDERATYSVEYGDIFFTRTSETIEEVGFSCVCKRSIPNATFAGFIIRLRPFCTDEKILTDYAKYYFRGEHIRAYLVKEMNLVTRASLGQTLLKGMSVIVPPKSVQKEIAEYLDDKCADIDALVAKKQQYLTEIENYKKSLIYEYVTGKKEVV